jgi:hypothetical protein
VHFTRLRTGSRAVRKVAGVLPRETDTNGSRVAYLSGTAVTVRRLAAPDSDVVDLLAGARASSLVMDRYRVGWLGADRVPVQSGRFGGSGDATTTAIERGNRALPAGTSGIALSRDAVRLFSDARGIHRIEPKLFRTE